MKRVLWTLAAVACGAVGGWMLGVDEYRAEAVVEFTPRMPKIIFQTDSSLSPELAHVRIGADIHVKRMTSRRVIESALESSDWAEGVSGDVDISAVALQQRVAARLVSETPSLIGYECTHPRPDVASAAVNAILEAYVEQCRADRPDAPNRRIRLEEHRVELVRALENSREKERAVSGGLGAKHIQTEYERRVESLGDLRAQLGLLDSLLIDAADVQRLPHPLEEQGGCAFRWWDDSDDDEDELELKQRVRELRKQLAVDRQALAELAPQRQDFMKIAHEREQLSHQLHFVDERLKQLADEEITWKDEPDPVRIVCRAETPTEPASSNRLEMAIVGALIGLVLAGGIGRFVDRRRTR